MKFLVIDELGREEMDKLVKNLSLHQEARKKGELPKLLFLDHVLHGDLPQLTQNMRWFKIYETDDPKQLANVEALYMAANFKSWKRWVIPITARSEVSDSYQKIEK